MRGIFLNKKCSYCGKLKPLSKFYNNRTSKDKKQTTCAECHSYIKKKYYKKKTNKKRHAKTVRVLKQKKVKFLKSILREYLSRHPCVDCRERDPAVLEFDHVNEAKKSQAISKMIGTAYPWEKILKEIEKCEVRCANCHRRRTLKQFGWNRV